MNSQQVVTYFPGCSLHGVSRPIDKSVKAVCNKLGISLRELTDWNCCGATSAHSIDHKLNLALGARNLSLAEETGIRTITTPCAACFSNLVHVRQVMQATTEKLFPVQVLHMLQLLGSPEMLKRCRENMTHELQNLKVVCYYGCLLVRPFRQSGFDDPENPQSLDRLIGLTGATVLDWSHKTECCGASLAVSAPELAGIRMDEILSQAKSAGADVIVVACPLCQSNLEMRQFTRTTDDNIPIVYFTQLLGLALGLSPRDTGLHQLLCNSFSWQEKIAKKIKGGEFSDK